MEIVEEAHETEDWTLACMTTSLSRYFCLKYIYSIFIGATVLKIFKVVEALAVRARS